MHVLDHTTMGHRELAVDKNIYKVVERTLSSAMAPAAAAAAAAADPRVERLQLMTVCSQALFQEAAASEGMCDPQVGHGPSAATGIRGPDPPPFPLRAGPGGAAPENFGGPERRI